MLKIQDKVVETINTYCYGEAVSYGMKWKAANRLYNYEIDENGVCE
jgi:hypothetical protein